MFYISIFDYMTWHKSVKTAKHETSHPRIPRNGFKAYKYNTFFVCQAKHKATHKNKCLRLFSFIYEIIARHKWLTKWFPVTIIMMKILVQYWFTWTRSSEVYIPRYYICIKYPDLPYQRKYVYVSDASAHVFSRHAEAISDISCGH